MMKRRVLDLLLLSLLIPGAILAWRTGEERSRLAAEYERLRRVTGDLPIGDPSQVYLRALDTGEPLHYAWRVYVPQNYRSRFQYQGGSSTFWSSNANQFIARIRIREDQQGILNLYTHFQGGSSRSSFGDKSLADFLRAHRNEISVEQLGADDVAVVAPTKTAPLLRLTLPEHLHADAKTTLSPHAQSFFPNLARFEFGPDTPAPQTLPPGG